MQRGKVVLIPPRRMFPLSARDWEAPQCCAYHLRVCIGVFVTCRRQNSLNVLEIVHYKSQALPEPLDVLLGSEFRRTKVPRCSAVVIHPDALDAAQLIVSASVSMFVHPISPTEFASHSLVRHSRSSRLGGGSAPNPSGHKAESWGQTSTELPRTFTQQTRAGDARNCGI